MRIYILFLLSLMASANTSAMSPPPPEPSPEPVIPRVDPIPGTPSLFVELSKTDITLNWSTTQDAEYYPVYAYLGGQWQHIEDNEGTQASYNYQQRGWNLNELQLKILACKAKPWWLWLAWWEHDRCSDWSVAQTVSNTLNPQLIFTHDDHTIDSELKYYLIWELQEVYDNPTLSIYYDDNESGYDGTLIIDNVNANDLRHDLNTSTLPAGNYYIYAVLTSHGKRYTSYAPYVISIENNQVETAPAVIEVTEQQQQQITQIMHNGNQGSMQIAASAVPSTWQQNSIIVIPPGQGLESGFSMKIEEVTINNNQATVTYTQPTFDEVMGKVSIKIDTPLKPTMNDVVVNTTNKPSVKTAPQQHSKPAAKQLINFVTPDIQRPSVGGTTNNNWFPDPPSVTAGWDSGGNISLQLNELMVYRNGDNSLKLSGGVTLGEPSIKYEFDYDSFNPNALHTSLELNYQLKQALNIDAALEEIELSAVEIANRAKQQNKYLCGNSIEMGSGSVEISGAAWEPTDVCLAKLSIGIGKVALTKETGETVLTPLALEIYLIMGADMQISALGAIDMSKDSQNSMKMVLSPRDDDYQLNATASNKNWVTSADFRGSGQAQIYTGVAPAIYTLGIYPVVMRAYSGVDIQSTTRASYPFTDRCVRATGDLMHGLTASLGLNIGVDFDLFGWSPTEGIAANYSKALDSPFGNKQLFKHITKDCWPQINITSPAFLQYADNSFLITWTAEAGNPAKIKLYYFPEGMDAYRILITADLDPTDTSYLWDTSAVPEGLYYIYAIIEDADSANRRNSSRSDGRIYVSLRENIGRYTRLDANGNLYTGNGDFNSEPWACVRDNHTGLMWEVKTKDGSIHDMRTYYNWGGIGAEAWDPYSDEEGYFDDWVYEYFRHDGDTFSESHPMHNAYFDDWNVLVNGSNRESLCGSSSWRIPTADELDTLSIRKPRKSWDSTVDPVNTPIRWHATYWASAPSRYNSIVAECWHYIHRTHHICIRHESEGVVLVSGGN